MTDDVECRRCGDTGELVTMVMGRSGLVACPACSTDLTDS